jgi:NitT/TauT family transport system substrate-binding protein
LAVSPASFAAHREEWKKLIKVWDRVVHYIQDPKTQDDAVKIMAARSGLEPAAYKPLLAGTHLLDVAAGAKVFKKADGLGSLYGSSKAVDGFNVKNAVYKEAQDVDSYIDPSLATGK